MCWFSTLSSAITPQTFFSNDDYILKKEFIIPCQKKKKKSFF